jgi:hypothetical protein
MGCALFGSSLARAAEPDRVECAAAYEQAQVARRDGRLLEARENLRVCQSSACPSAVSRDCAAWLGEVEGSIPSLVVDAVDAQGAPITPVTLTIDDQPRTRGAEVELDPGSHVVRISAPDHLPFRTTLTLRPGQRGKTLSVSLTRVLPAERVEPRPSVRSRSPAPLYAFGGLTALGGLGFVGFGAQARKHDRELGRCSPGCSEADVRRTKRDYLLANVSLGVGVAGAAASLTWIVTRPKRPNQVGLSLEVGPNRSGLVARGRFE